MRKILIVGANSILTKSLIDLLSPEADIEVAFHSKPGLSIAVQYFPIQELFLKTDNYDYIYVISSVISNKIDDSQSLFDVNVGLLQLISSKFQTGKILFCSSVSVYDAIRSGNIEDETLVSPSSVYGISKLWAEQIVKQHPRYGILRIASMYGAGMKTNTFLPQVIFDAINMKRIRLLGSGNRLQNYIHVEDVAMLLKGLAMSASNDTVLGISPRNYSNLEVAELIAIETGAKIEFHGNDSSRSVAYCSGNKNLKKHKFISLSTGIRELIAWKKRLF